MSDTTTVSPSGSYYIYAILGSTGTYSKTPEGPARSVSLYKATENYLTWGLTLFRSVFWELNRIRITSLIYTTIGGAYRSGYFAVSKKVKTPRSFNSRTTSSRTTKHCGRTQGTQVFGKLSSQF